MKYIYVAYTLLETMEVPDDITPDGIEELLDEDLREKGIYDIVNDVEWSYAD